MMAGGSRSAASGIVWLGTALLLSLLAFVPAAFANGGTVQLASQAAGPYALTVFTDPTPIRVGTADVSVLVQRMGSDAVVQDARVSITAKGLDEAGDGRVYEATHEQATNKLYYAANVRLPSAGRWRIGVQVSGAEGEGAVSFDVEASGAGALDNPLLLIALGTAPALLALWWLSRGRERPER